MVKDVKSLLKSVVELIMPDMDHYRKPLRKGRVIATYASDGRYVCDIEILLNTDELDESEPIVSGVEIPILWGGASRGVVCPPAVGTYCDVEYYHGDPDYPRISNFRWLENNAPNVGTDELIIQQKDGVHIHIKADGSIDVRTPAKLDVTIGKQIVIKGDQITINGGSGDISGVVTHKCYCPITGAPHIDFSSDVHISK